MPMVYKIPLPENFRDEFDGLDLHGTKQTVVECPLACGARYSLITAEDASPETIAHYSNRVRTAIGNCNQHPEEFFLSSDAGATPCGAPEVIATLARFEEAGLVLNNPRSQAEFVGVVNAMREDKTQVEDLKLTFPISYLMWWTIRQPLKKARRQQQILFWKVGTNCFCPLRKTGTPLGSSSTETQQNGMELSDTRLSCLGE